MSETYEINERNQVIPYTSGRKCTDARSWRDATDLELQQIEQIEQLERELAEAINQGDMWKANHDNQVAINRAIRDRPDMGERARLVDELIKHRDTLASALRESQRQLQYLDEKKPRVTTELVMQIVEEALSMVEGGQS